MSTKNLARTVIEGGRTGFYKSDVDNFASSERAASRSYLRLVSRDPDAADDLAAPVRKPVQPSFADKIAPAYRFLDARIGKSWKKVFADVCAKFDLRTTPGRHIIQCHLLKVIARCGEHRTQRYGYYLYFVDRHGILRATERRRPRGVGTQAARVQPFDEKALLTWLGKRKVGQQGDRFVWWVPVQKDAPIVVRWGWSGPVYSLVDEEGRTVAPVVTDVSSARRTVTAKRFPSVWERYDVHAYRPAGLLRGDDEAFFRSLPESARTAVLQAAPSNGDAEGRVWVDHRPVHLYR